MKRSLTTGSRPSSRDGHDLDAAYATVERSLSHLARLARPSRIFGEVIDADGRPIDRAAYSVLTRVEEFGPIRLTDLAIAMEIDISTASRQVRSLEDRGLVRRGDVPGDQRASLLQLTEAGIDVLERSRALRLAGIRKRLAGWDDPDLCALARLLERFAATLSGPAEGAPSPDACPPASAPSSKKEPANT